MGVCAESAAYNFGMSISDAITAYRDGKYANALETFKPMVEAGHAVAQNYLGEMYQHGAGVEHDPSEAVKWFRKSAEQDYSDAQLNLAGMCFDGSGTKQQ